MAYTPTKRCDRLDIHEMHEWYQDKVFRRQCPGRTTTRQRSRNVRRRETKREQGKNCVVKRTSGSAR